MQQQYLKKNFIKIPTHITLVYSVDKNLITLLGPISKKSFHLKTRIVFLKSFRTLIFTSIPITPVSNKQKKLMPAVRGTCMALLRQYMTEISWISYVKLKFVGVGYRSFYVENFNNTLLLLKLGFSHFVYIKIPENFKSFCIKFTKLFIYGNIIQDLSKIVYLIKSYKTPEPYKGKGICHYNEKIELKIGKRTSK